ERLAERLQLALEAAADLLAEVEHARVDDPVVDVGACLAAADDPRLEQQAEVLGNVLLRGPGRLDQLLHGRLATVQPELLEDADAHRLAEDAEPLFDQLDERVEAGEGASSDLRQRTQPHGCK